MKNCTKKFGRSKKARRRRFNTPWSVAAVALTVLVATRHHALAGPDHPGDLIGGTSACPDPGAVWSALSILIGPESLESRLRTLAAQGPAIAVTDLGAAYRIRAGNQVREYDDDARDCAERAKVAALFVALAVDSVEHAAQAKAGAPAPERSLPVTVPVVGARESVPASPKERLLVLEVGVGGHVGVNLWAAAPGGLVRVSGGRGRLALVVGIRGSGPVDATIEGVRVRQWRAAADLAVRARWLPDQPVTPFIELGAVGALLSERAPDLAVESTHLIGEVGFAVGGGIGFRPRSWGSAFFLVEGEVDPDPPTLSALPTGSLGHTPYMWLGAAAGLSVGLF